ncbi:MAG: TonB family protein [Flavobacteriales bacterium]
MIYTIEWLTKVLLCQGVILLAYLIIKSEPLFSLRRVWMIGALLVPLILPFVEGSFLTSESGGHLFFYEFEPVTVYAGSKLQSLSWSAIMFWSVTIVIGLKLVGFLRTVFFVVFRTKKIAHGLRVWNGSFSFSFFRIIILAEKDQNDEMVLAHESAHVQMHHYFDLIVSEIVTGLFWFSPFVWIFNRELKKIHEFQADQYVLKVFGVIEYKECLFEKATGFRPLTGSHSFGSLTLKNRFMMMTKKSSAFAGTRIVFATIVLFSWVAMVAFAAQEQPPGSKSESQVPLVDVENQPDVYPVYPGGQDAMMKYLSGSINYPESARIAGKEGKVVVKFVVDKTGKIKDVKIASGVEASLDAEAMRVVKEMPDWTPGEKGGKKVNVEMVLPIQFKL